MLYLEIQTKCFSFVNQKILIVLVLLILLKVLLVIKQMCKEYASKSDLQLDVVRFLLKPQQMIIQKHQADGLSSFRLNLKKNINQFSFLVGKCGISPNQNRTFTFLRF